MKIKKIRSLLFVPGHKINFLKDLSNIEADAFAIDLEDAVPTNKKENARSNLHYIKSSKLFKEIFVRINYDKENLIPDIISCNKTGIRNFILPKINSKKDIKFIQKLFSKYLKIKKYNIMILIESSQAIINLKEICSSSKKINGLMFGAEDYLNDINILEFYNKTNIDYPRSIIPLYAHAFKLNCIDTPYLNLKDTNKFKQHLADSKSLGYTGILNIHPNQCVKSNKNYSPTKADFQIAKKIVNSNKMQKYQNQNISVLRNKLVGPPLIKRAKKIIDYFDE
jgi:citrate lyase subunit beta / citryl-CoA lyase